MSGREEVGIPLTVALERRAMAMEGVAVEFGDEPFGTPEQIDAMVGDLLVDLGSPEAVTHREREERVLEGRASRRLGPGQEQASAAAVAWAWNEGAAWPMAYTPR